jgi:hypothetical protein
VLIVSEELGLQDVEAIEFGEEVCGGIGDGPQGVLGVKALPFGEALMSAVEFEVVHVPVTELELGFGAPCRRHSGAEETSESQK